jgi:osmotically-inducible protein OsmY
LTAGAGAGATAQHARNSDLEIERLVADRLEDEEIGGVEVAAASGIVTLRGTVPTLWVKQRAVRRLPASTTSLTGVVNTEVERRKAEIIARGTFGMMSVTNKLRKEREE